MEQIVTPFKFLDAYEKADAGRYFGRNRETAQLYNAVFGARMTLVYGGSGTGKTSLIKCGLGNKLYDTDWLPLYIRRNRDINESLRTSLLSALSPGRSALLGANPSDIPTIVHNLYLDHYKPIYLIFDQFEEIFIEEQQEEQAAFYSTVRTLVQSEMALKILIVMREEWLGHLSNFESQVPALFDNRLRIERIREQVLWCTVIPGMIRAAGIELREPRETLDLILKQIRDAQSTIDLPDLQVYLDRLYRQAVQTQGSEQLYFDTALVSQVGEMQNVLEIFLEEQMERLSQMLQREFRLANSKNIPLDILYTLVTNEQTKRALTADAIYRELPAGQDVSPEVVKFCLDKMVSLRLLNLFE